jgi:hypothetical protein
LFKNRNLVHVNTALDVELFILFHQLLNLHLENVDFIQSLLELIVLVLETLDVDFPCLELLQVSDQLVVLLLETVVVVGTSVELGSQSFAVVSESGEDVKFWGEATCSLESVKNISDSLLLLNFKIFDFSEDSCGLGELITETTDSLNWYEEPVFNNWRWSDGINEDWSRFVLDDFLLKNWSILSWSINNSLLNYWCSFVLDDSLLNWSSLVLDDSLLNWSILSWSHDDLFFDSWSFENDGLSWSLRKDGLSSSWKSNDTSQVVSRQSGHTFGLVVILPLADFSWVHLT